MRTVLLVDDSKVVRRVARRFLQEFGFRVDEVEDGAQAIGYCRAIMPDAVLLDWNMPVMNGIDFLGALRAMAGGGEPKVVFCTTENSIKFVQAALAAGANEYIIKPFDRGLLRDKFEAVGLLPRIGA